MTESATRTIFMTSGPEIELTVPATFDPTPVLTTVIGLPKGRRRFTFSPYPVAAWEFGSRRFTHRSRGASRGGYEFDVFERLEPPRLWFVRWDIGSGMLVCHLREEDGLEASRLLEDSLEIAVHRNGAVILLPSSPLRRGASGRPGHDEAIVFYDRVITPRQMLRLARPGHLREGEMRWKHRAVGSEDSNWFVLGTGVNVDVEVQGDIAPERAEIVASDVAKSIRGV